MALARTPVVCKKHRFFGVLAIALVSHISAAAGADVCIDFRPGGAELTNEGQAQVMSFIKEISEHPTPDGGIQIEVYYADDSDLPGIGLASDRARSLMQTFLSRNGNPTPWIEVLLRAHEGKEFARANCATAVICTRGDRACTP